MQHAGLRGREAELDMLGGLLDGTREHGGCLLIRGAPGVGKTALLDAAAAHAADRGWRVLRTVGTPSEQRLPLAALHRLLRPVIGHLDGLTPAQRDALRGGFGYLGGPRPEIYRVALAALDLLAEVAGRGPVAVVVDDMHWLDRPSAEVLAFIARRLESDPVLLLAAGRNAAGNPLSDGTLPELALNGLAPRAAEDLLDSAAPGLDQQTRRDLLRDADGNPLALLELPKALQSGEAGQLPPGLLTLTRRLEQAFAGRASGLPPACRDLLLLAALSDSASIAEILKAGTALRPGGVTVTDLDAATAAGLLRTDQLTVRFRHPLVRSAIYQSAPPSQRRAAHAALASALGGDVDRRAWHRASSVIGTDEEVAAELEATALRTASRGLAPSAVHALERAAALSPSPASHGRRLLLAAELAQDAGQGELSERLLRQTGKLALTAGERLRAEWVRELQDEAMQGGPRRIDILAGLAKQASRGGDLDLAAQFLLQAAKRCWHINLGPEAGQRVLAAADSLDLGATDPRRIVILAYAAPMQSGPEVIRLLAGRDARPGDDPGDLLLLGHAAACVGAFHEAETYCAAAADGLREQGLLAPLCQALSLLAWAGLRRGRWPAAIPAADECVRLSREIGQPVPLVAGLAAQAMMAAVRGDEPSGAALIAQAEPVARATGNTIGLALIQLARATAAAGGARPAEAYEALQHVFQPADAAYQRMQACWALGTLAEAGAAGGHQLEVLAEVAEVTRLAGGQPSAGVDAALRLASAALARHDSADDRFRAALDADLSDWPFEHGRILLAYGGWLRRRKQVTQARERLRAARDELDRIGARPWSERARRELRAAGELSGRPAATAWGALTPQEMHVAQLAAEGLDNKEIAALLYLSPRTVQSHLYRVFPKLQITSRAQLAAAMFAARPA